MSLSGKFAPTSLGPGLFRGVAPRRAMEFHQPFEANCINSNARMLESTPTMSSDLDDDLDDDSDPQYASGATIIAQVVAGLTAESLWSTSTPLELLFVLHSCAALEDPAGPWRAAEQALFGDPTSHVQESEGGQWDPGFGATQMGGPDIDLARFAGISASDCIDYQWTDAVYECGGNVEELSSFEGGPGASDTWYWIECGKPLAFARKLRVLLAKQIIKQHLIPEFATD